MKKIILIIIAAIIVVGTPVFAKKKPKKKIGMEAMNPYLQNTNIMDKFDYLKVKNNPNAADTVIEFTTCFTIINSRIEISEGLFELDKNVEVIKVPTLLFFGEKEDTYIDKIMDGTLGKIEEIQPSSLARIFLQYHKGKITVVRIEYSNEFLES